MALGSKGHGVRVIGSPISQPPSIGREKYCARPAFSCQTAFQSQRSPAHFGSRNLVASLRTSHPSGSRLGCMSILLPASPITPPLAAFAAPENPLFPSASNSRKPLPVRTSLWLRFWACRNAKGQVLQSSIPHGFFSSPLQVGGGTQKFRNRYECNSCSRSIHGRESPKSHFGFLNSAALRRVDA